jgi:hypothetical protein
VTPAQLQAREGKVRCGRCMHAFDGFDALATDDMNADGDVILEAVATPASIEAEHTSGARKTELAAESLEAPERAPASTPPDAPDGERPSAPINVEVPNSELPSAPVNVEVPSAELPSAPVNVEVPNSERPSAPINIEVPSGERPIAPVNVEVPNDEPSTAGTPQVATVETASPAEPAADTAGASAAVQDMSPSAVAPLESSAESIEARNATVEEAARASDIAPRWTRPETEPLPEPFLVPKRRHAGWWTGGCVVLVLALVLQIAYAYRGDIAARYPAAKPALIAFCETARCSVALPQRPELVKIEASDVHMIDANRPALIQLTATLRSYAAYDLAYPALDLVLTNANEHALVRRIFLPHEYLGGGRDPQAGIPPNAEITVAVELDTGDLDAAGFRLDLRPAPTL